MAPTRIPTFLLWARIGLINTCWPLVLPDWFCGSTCYVFLLRQLFLTPRIVPRKRPGGVIDRAGRIK